MVARMVFCTRTTGVLSTVRCSWDGVGWSVDACSVENPNEWNNGNQVFSRNYCISPAYVAGVFFCSPFFHPPSIRPISSNLLESSAYLSVGTSLFSHAVCRKNFKTSKRDIVLPKKIILCSGGR